MRRIAGASLGLLIVVSLVLSCAPAPAGTATPGVSTATPGAGTVVATPLRTQTVVAGGTTVATPLRTSTPGGVATSTVATTPLATRTVTVVATAGATGSPAATRTTAVGATATPGAVQTGTPGGTAQGAFDAVVAEMEYAGARVVVGGAVSSPAFTDAAQSRNMTINGQNADVYAFSNATAATRARGTVGNNATTIGGRTMTWTGTPRLYQSGRFIVIYQGSDQAVMQALETAFGEPFAEGQG